ncbi:WXG100-like domain-containing protein [Lentzea sp. NPDC055074]
MSITIPSEITWLFPIVVGESWPEGDEDKLRALGDAWRAASADIDEVITQAGNAATKSFGAMEGQAADAFGEYWKKFVEGADAYLVKLKESCDGLAGSCDNTALEVEYAKYAIIAALIMLAIEIAALIAAAFGTFGTSTAGIPIAQAATRITVQMIFRKLITAILREVLTEVAIDAAIQGIQIAKGDRHSWDWNKTGSAALSGAISGAIGGGMDFVPTRATGLGGNVVEGAVRGGVEGVASTVANAAVTGEDITAGDLARSGVSGGVSGGIGGATSHYDAPTAPGIGDGPGAPPPPGGPPAAPPGPSGGPGGGPPAGPGGPSGGPSAPPVGPSNTPGSTTNSETSAAAAAPPAPPVPHAPSSPSQPGSSTSGGPAPFGGGGVPMGGAPSGVPSGGSSSSGGPSSGGARPGGFAPTSPSGFGGPTPGGAHGPSPQGGPSSQPSSGGPSPSGQGGHASTAPGGAGGGTPGGHASPGGSPASGGPGGTGTSGSPGGPANFSGTGNSGGPGNAGGPGNFGGAGNPGGPGNAGGPANVGGPSNAGVPGNSGGSGIPGGPANAGGPGNPGVPGNFSNAGNPGAPGNSGPGNSGPGNSGPGNSGPSHAAGPLPHSPASSAPHPTGPAPNGNGPGGAPHAMPNGPASHTTATARAETSTGPAFHSGPADVRPAGGQSAPTHRGTDSPAGLPPAGGMPLGGAQPGSPGGTGGSPSAGSRPGWTGTPGSPAPNTPHGPGPRDHAPGRPDQAGSQPPHRPGPPSHPGTHGPASGPGPRPAGPDHAGSQSPVARGPVAPPHGGQPQHAGLPDNGRHPGTSGQNGPDQHDPRASQDADGGPGAPRDTGPLSPDEVNQRHAEPTPAGVSYHRGDADMGDLPQRVRPDSDGRYTVDVHIDPDGHANIGGRRYTPEQFAEVLRRGGDYDGRPIRLIGCDASANGFAPRLAQALGTEVMAPNRPAWTDSGGRVFSSDYEVGPDGGTRPRIPPTGEWSVHSPDGTSTRVGEDGFTPDTPDSDKHQPDPDSARARGDGDGDTGDEDQDGDGRPDRYADTDWDEEWGDYEVSSDDPDLHRPIIEYDRPGLGAPDASPPDNPYNRPPDSPAPTIRTEMPARALFPPLNRDLPERYQVPRALRGHPELFENGRLRPDTAIPVEYLGANGEVAARTTFYTDSAGAIRWVELSPGAQLAPDGTRAGTNPDFNQVLPNCQYRVENWRDPSRHMHFETNERGQAVRASGQPSYGASDDNYRDQAAQNRAAREGWRGREDGTGAPYATHPDHSQVRWAGGHLLATESGAPGGYGNQHGQMAASNSGNNRDGWTRVESWRLQEEQIAAHAKQDGHDVELLEVEVLRREGDGMAPEEVMRWHVRDTDPETGEPRVRVFQRTFVNVPENLGISDWSGVPRYGE